MLMANSVEGRFPFLDAEVVAVANALPAWFKLRGLDEKHVLKRVAAGLVPDAIVRRPKQPYRAPDAPCFVRDDAPRWVAETMNDAAIAASRIFDGRAVARLWRKCCDARNGPFSNADNMAIAGVLSTALLHERFVRRPPAQSAPRELRTWVDRLARPETSIQLHPETRIQP
jgi:asparagine synthase (glutamine-hydrolysing)